ncbi:MAG: PEGA domain-containing protein [Candidatus Omnitrophota bacterium]
MYQRIRAFLFYLSIAVFFVTVPITLLFSLGYDITWRRLKVSRVGLLEINSTPAGATVYLNEKDTRQTTPAILRELKPGSYALRLELKDYYPWQNNVEVAAGKVTSIEEVILFREIPYLVKLNNEETENFVLNEKRDAVYFIGKSSNTLYRAELKAKVPQPVYPLPVSASRIKKWMVSPDEKKVFYYLGNRLYVGFLTFQKIEVGLPEDFIIAVPEDILEVFWHADSAHLLVATSRHLRLYELFSQGQRNTVVLADLNLRHPQVFYDAQDNCVYFTGLQESPVGKFQNLYRLPLAYRALFSFVEEQEKNK